MTGNPIKPYIKQNLNPFSGQNDTADFRKNSSAIETNGSFHRNLSSSNYSRSRRDDSRSCDSKHKAPEAQLKKVFKHPRHSMYPHSSHINLIDPMNTQKPSDRSRYVSRLQDIILL